MIISSGIRAAKADPEEESEETQLKFMRACNKKYFEEKNLIPRD